MRYLFLAIALAATPGAVWSMQAGPVKAGVDAWARGEYKKAVEQWRGPAGTGDADAQFNLGQAYKLGRGVNTDLAAAEDWYRKAALQGHPQAEENYGLALFQNNKRADAVKWLEKGVARGEPRSQFVLGTMLFNGDAVSKDWVRAYALMVRANSTGLPQAGATLAQMDRYIGLQDRQKGLALARQYESQGSRTALAAATVPEPAPAPAARTPTPRATPSPAPAAKAATPAPKPAPKPAARADGGWRVQLGAFREEGNARGMWGKVSGSAALSGARPYYVKAGTVTRLLAGPFGSSAEASRACATLKRAGTACLPVKG